MSSKNNVHSAKKMSTLSKNVHFAKNCQHCQKTVHQEKTPKKTVTTQQLRKSFATCLIIVFFYVN